MQRSVAAVCRRLRFCPEPVSLEPPDLEFSVKLKIFQKTPSYFDSWYLIPIVSQATRIDET